MPITAARVLTAENDPIVRSDLRLILEDAGFGVCPEARDGVEAVELAREHAPDLILIDLSLPRLDGIEATRRILEEREVPIVALRGDLGGDSVERALEAGAVSHVLKPFSARHLVGVLHGVLNEQAEREAEQHHLRAYPRLGALGGRLGRVPRASRTYRSRGCGVTSSKLRWGLTRR